MHFIYLIIVFVITTLMNNAHAAPDQRCQSILNLSAPTKLESLSQLTTRFLKAHNDIRKIYGVPPLVWDAKLAEYAQAWANNLKATKKCQLMHRTQPPYGENLGMNWTSLTLAKTQFDKSPEFTVQNWAKECKDYNPANNTCLKGKVCGHFTQVIWKTSKKVGCGVVMCDGSQNSYNKGRVELWVCNYDPPGNYIGQRPF